MMRSLRLGGARAAAAPRVRGAALGWLAFALTTGATGAQEPLRFDRSAGSTAGLVWFVSSAQGAPEDELFVGVAIGRLAEAPLEQAFALWRQDGEPALGAPASTPGELTSPGRSVIEVVVEHRAHDEIRHLIARWAQGEQEGSEPAVRIENLLDRVARVLGLKSPYRSVLRGSDPVAYLRDLARLNGAER
ncbi:MAG TPA: hypothetical protein VMV46_21435 [Thermoanaerobaculia bacterium]|nr:hypothetical protein [Thermoanaerobaculia bacterium]